VYLTLVIIYQLLIIPQIPFELGVTAIRLSQLPADIGDFTGRNDEIDTIRQQLLGGKSLVISAVAGMPGVGKSALAIHVAWQLAESDFSDVRLYVDLRGADGDSLEPGVVLARWLRAFGLDESMIPSDLHECASVYRSRLAGKRAIILLDNAKDEAQVRPSHNTNGFHQPISTLPFPIR
jgi:hypothetical protein